MVAFFLVKISIICYRELHSTSHRVDCFLENFVCLHPFLHEHLVTVVVSFACCSDSTWITMSHTFYVRVGQGGFDRWFSNVSNTFNKLLVRATFLLLPCARSVRELPHISAPSLHKDCVPWTWVWTHSPLGWGGRRIRWDLWDCRKTPCSPETVSLIDSSSARIPAKRVFSSLRYCFVRGMFDAFLVTDGDSRDWWNQFSCLGQFDG
jgi:hypothetical protein